MFAVVIALLVVRSFIKHTDLFNKLAYLCKLKTLAQLKKAHELIERHQKASCHLKSARHQKESFAKSQPSINVSGKIFFSSFFLSKY